MEKELPKNWVTAELNQIFSYVIGGDWGKDTLFDDADYVEALCIRGSEIKNWNRDKGSTASLRKIKKSSLNSRKLEFGDILLEISGGGPEQPVGRTVIVDDEVLNYEKEKDKVCTNFLRLVRVDNKLNSFYVNYYLQYFYHSGEIVKYQGGSNNLRNLKYKEYETISIPLPPLSEQNRIVEKLDRLLGQLEMIKTSMAKIPVLLKNFRQQVLTQAVTGKLTEEWRVGKELLNVFKDRIITDYKTIELPISWSLVFIEDFADVKGGKRLPKGSDFIDYKTNYPYIRARDLKFGTVLTDKMVYISEDVQKVIKNYIVRTNDLYITIVGAKIGDAGSIPKEMDGANLTENAAKLTNLNKDIYYKYISYFLRSEISQKNISETIMSAAQGKLALTRIKKLPVYLPSLQEQQKIVSRVESLFAKADAIEEKYKNLKAKIETLPQTILHKAFKGELSEQFESDGDAKDLLEEIMALKRTK